MQQPSPRGSNLGPLLLAFVAGAIGGAAGALLVQPRGPAASDAEDPGLRQSVAALDETVGALATQLAALSRSNPLPAVQPSVPLQGSSGGNGSTGGVPDFGPLLGRLDEVTKLLQQRAVGGSPGFAGASPLPLLQPRSSRSNAGALSALVSEDDKEVWRRHAFWTCQQVLDAYGLPDQIEAGDGTMGWYYETAGRTVHFVFFEGMLINFWN